LRKKVLITYLALLLLPVCSPADAEDERITTVRVVGPSWEQFTNEDGTGLYHEILNAVFDLYGIEVKREYMPSQRAYESVEDGTADMMTCKAHSVSPPLVLGRYPMFINHYHVFFNKQRIGKWKGRASLSNRLLVWRVSYYLPEEFADVSIDYRELSTGSQALGMVLLGRADFYVDDVNLIEESIRNSRIVFNPTLFDIQSIGSRSYHPVFNDSPRGGKIMRLYDDGMLRLHKDGKLKSIFEKWGFDYPDFDAF